MSEKNSFYAPLPLQTRWLSLIGHLPTAQRAWDVLESAYTEPHRHYHNLVHIEDGLNVLDRLNAAHVVKVAFWFHDVVYVAGASDNERLSAILAHDTLFPNVFDAGDLWEIGRLILLTKDHKVEWFDKNGCDMIVADLHGLGADKETYRRNGANIRKEYGAFTDEEWRAGRKKFLGDRTMRRTFPPHPEYASIERMAEWNMGEEWKELKYGGK